MLLALYLGIGVIIGILSNYRSRNWTMVLATLVVLVGVALNAVINNVEYLALQKARLGAFVFEALFHYTLPSLVGFLVPFACGRYGWLLFQRIRGNAAGPRN